MGYAHGIKWTDELIKEKVTEVVIGLKLDRMPSRSECVGYFQNNALACVISRRMGWYELAKQMNLNIKKSDTLTGKRQEAIAKKQLESKGYEVTKMSQNFPYDLLVNSCLKIDVKVSRLHRGEKGSFYTFNLDKPYCTCDIYMLYLSSGGTDEPDILIVPSVAVFDNTQISVGEKESKYYKYSNRWDYIKRYVDFMAQTKQGVNGERNLH